MIRAARALLALAPLLVAAPAEAAREAVLYQVKLPHNYYWRELYIPQLTTGPSSVAFMPSGDELIYSMRRLAVAPKGRARTMPANSRIRVAAYDHQPDVAPDGRCVVFARYDGKAFELWRHDFAVGRRTGAHRKRRRQPRAAHLAGRSAGSPSSRPPAPGTST